MIIFLFFWIGCCVGSFFCLLAQRIPANRSAIFPASHCEACGTPLLWYELIPLLSILFLRFRCRHCHIRLSFWYFGAEIFCGVFFLFSPLTAGVLSWLRFFWLLATFLLALADLFYQIVEPKFFYPCTLILWFFQWQQTSFQWLTIGYCLFLSGFVWLFYSQKFGGGDLLLLLSWSPWLPLYHFCLLLLLASLFGLVLFSCSSLLKRPLKELPFVPCLLGGLLVIFLRYSF
ncbi:A24 family peptidase [Enterococcus songbeiensis]|uniref:A24 family peptidase n=1 Tax=Enterococcus songbeiensis TaxID=2559927 RepID=UPI001FEB42E3|nr:prepilin peptidase [Enterococcus songbeiensis]